MVYDLHPMVIMMAAGVGRDDGAESRLRHVKGCGDAKVGGPTPQMMSTKTFWPISKTLQTLLGQI